VKNIAALFAVVGLAAVASAQTYTIETRWVAVTTTAAQGAVGAQRANLSTADKVSPLVLNRGSADANTVIYAQRYELQARVTNVTGQNNLGIFALRGNINASEAAIGGSASPAGSTGDRPPFTFGPVTEQFRLGGVASAASRVDQIFNFSADRDAFPAASWNYDSTAGAPGPFPAAPAAAGNAGFVSVFRVLVSVVGGSDRSVTIGAVQGDSRGLQAWNSVPNPVPEPTEDLPTTSFNYLGLQMTGERTLVNSSFQIDVVPAPSSLALVGLGGLVAARRRRA
jgi:hypothetical protein